MKTHCKESQTPNSPHKSCHQTRPANNSTSKWNPIGIFNILLKTNFLSPPLFVPCGLLMIIVICLKKQVVVWGWKGGFVLPTLTTVTTLHYYTTTKLQLHCTYIIITLRFHYKFTTTILQLHYNYTSTSLHYTTPTLQLLYNYTTTTI